MNGSITIREVSGCARCGGDHRDVWARQFTQPIVLSQGDATPNSLTLCTHWFMCPRLDEPVLVAIVDGE